MRAAEDNLTRSLARHVPRSGDRLTRHRRLLVIISVTAAVGASILGATAATAARAIGPVADGAPSTTAVGPSGRVSIGGGLSFSGAIISHPGTPTRRLDAYKAAVFVQSWIGYVFLGRARRENPPTDLPIYRVDVTGTWNGGTDITTLPVFYVSDGRTAWLAFPAERPTTSSSTVGLPRPGVWVVAPPRVIDAFAGTATLVPTAGTATTTPAPTAAVRQRSSRAAAGPIWPWVAIVLVVVVAVTGAATAWTRTRRHA